MRDALRAAFHFPNYRVRLQRDVDAKSIEMRERVSRRPRSPSAHANEKALICDSINASAREIIGNNCRGYPRRASALFRGFNDVDDGPISRSVIIAVMRLPLFSGHEQVGISLNSASPRFSARALENKTLYRVARFDDGFPINHPRHVAVGCNNLEISLRAIDVSPVIELEMMN